MNTYVERASRRVERERETVEAKRRAYRRFRSRLRSMRSRSGPADATARSVPGGGNEVIAGSTGGGAVRPIREAFAETVASACEDRPTVELLATELGEGVATALAADGASPPLRRAVLAESDRRCVQLAAMDRALDAEADSLTRASETVEPIREWLIEANETPLSACGFEKLRARHERLADSREDCAALLSARQEHLGRTTSADGRAGLRHRELVDHLYGAFPIDHPVLVTATRLEELCVDCQRVVRDHLVRRV